MKPMVHRLEAEYWGKVDFVYLDQYDSDNQAIMDRYGINWRPSFVLVKPDGTTVTGWFGARSEEDIRAELDNLLVVVGGG